MLAFPMLLVSPAQEAGITVPKNLDDFDPEQFPRFHVFCCIQLGARMPSPTSHWDNAKVIASLTDDEVKTVTLDELVNRGLSI